MPVFPFFRSVPRAESLLALTLPLSYPKPLFRVNLKIVEFLPPRTASFGRTPATLHNTFAEIELRAISVPCDAESVRNFAASYCPERGMCATWPACACEAVRSWRTKRRTAHRAPGTCSWIGPIGSTDWPRRIRNGAGAISQNRRSGPWLAIQPNRVGGGVAAPVLPHHRTY
jgi:hypothetical protein